MRITDFFLVLPTFVLALILAPVILDIIGADAEFFGIRATLLVIIVVIGLTSWATTARIIRSQTLSLKERMFVDRARVIGAGPGHIMRRHILPNVVNLIVAQAVLTFAGAVFTETTLSFIGLGDPFAAVVGPDPQRRPGGRRARASGAWWYIAPPAVCVVLVVLAFTLVGNALDDILNPKLGGAAMTSPTGRSLRRRQSAATDDRRDAADRAPRRGRCPSRPTRRPAAGVETSDALQARRDGQGRRRRELQAQRRRGARHRRRVGLRQDHDRAVARAAAAGERAGSSAAASSCSASTSCTKSENGAAPLSLARDRDRLPGRDERAEPGPARSASRSPSRSRSASASHATRAPGAAGELLELVGHPARRAAGLSARAVGRDAPAGDDRDGPRLRSGDRHRRRADDGPRRHGPGPDPGAPRAAPPRARARRSSSSRTTCR